MTCFSVSSCSCSCCSLLVLLEGVVRCSHCVVVEVAQRHDGKQQTTRWRAGGTSHRERMIGARISAELWHLIIRSPRYAEVAEGSSDDDAALRAHAGRARARALAATLHGRRGAGHIGVAHCTAAGALR